MASPFWGLYEDLPPTANAPAAANTTTNKPDLSEWTSNPKLAKMMPTAVRKKSVPMVPRAAAVAKPKASPKTEPKSQTPEKTEEKPKENALSLVFEAYASDTQAMEVVEEYDPARPNEYDKYVADRMHRQKMEREEEARREYEASHREEKNVIDLSVSGEDAFARRARLSGRPASPPTPLRSQDDDIDGEALDAPHIPSQPVSSPKESVAARMMARMGWREGSGLGKEEQGMTTALVHKRTDRKIAVIVNAPPTKSSRSLRIPPPSEQSKVILLKNMVGPGEVDDDLESETASECGKYGEVVKCLIFEVVGDLVSPIEAVRIFIHFVRQESALKAFIDLNGRFFGGRQVNATFFNESRFLANNLAPSAEELEQITNQQT